MVASPNYCVRAGFTLVEMLAALAVLGILIVTGCGITVAASSLLTINNKHMDADDQARMVLDRMANDFARMSKRHDVDFLFWKPVNNTPTKGINDTMYFFTEAAGYFDSTTFVAQGIPPGATASSEQNAVTLAGYRVNDTAGSASYNQLERIGLPLSWDGGNYAVNPNHKHSGPTYAMSFLTYPPAGTSASGDKNGNHNGSISTAYESSLIEDNYPEVGTEAGNYNDGSDPTYATIGSQIFRMEYAFQLKDGTMSDKPVMVYTSGSSNGVPSSTITASAPPQPTNDSSTAGGGWSVGSRWWDATNEIGYICIDPTPSYAVWHEIGVQDVAAIIVTIAVIDRQGLAYMKAKNGNLNNVAALLPDYVGGNDPAYLLNPGKTTSWAYALLPGNAVSKMAAPKLSQSMISQIRLYQRCFYLENY